MEYIKKHGKKYFIDQEIVNGIKEDLQTGYNALEKAVNQKQQGQSAARETGKAQAYFLLAGIRLSQALRIKESPLQTDRTLPLQGSLELYAMGTGLSIALGQKYRKPNGGTIEKLRNMREKKGPLLGMAKTAKDLGHKGQYRSVLKEMDKVNKEHVIFLF